MQTRTARQLCSLFLLFGSDLDGDRFGLPIEGLARGAAEHLTTLDIRQRDGFALTGEAGGVSDVNQLAVHGKRLGGCIPGVDLSMEGLRCAWGVLLRPGCLIGHRE